MIEVEVGDSIVEFPDGTSPEVMQAALRKQFGAPQQQPSAETPQGRPAIPSASNMLLSHLNLSSGASQRTSPNVGDYQGKFLSDKVEEFDSGELGFRDQSGKLVMTDSKKHVVLRDPSDNRVKVFARSEDTNEDAADSAARVLAPGLATVPLARTPGVLQAPPPLRPGAASAEAAARQGIELPRAISSDSFLVNQGAVGLSKIPLIGNRLISKTEDAVTGMGDVVKDIAKLQGGANVEGAGQKAGSGIKSWLGSKSSDEITQLYDEVGNVVDQNVRGPLDETLKTVSEIAARNANMSFEGGSRAADLVKGAITNPAGLNYNGVKDLRTRIGQMLDNPSVLPVDMPEAELRQIYGALSKDLGNITELGGGKKGRALWEFANWRTAKINEQRERLAEIVGKGGDASPAQILDRIKAAASGTTRADTDLLMRAKQTIGKDWDEVTSAITGNLGINAKGEFTPQIFLNNWHKLSPSGKSALYSEDHRKTLDDIARMAERWPKLQKFQNPSGTGMAQLTIGGIGTAIVGPMQVLAAVFDPTVIGGAVGAKMLANVLAKPATAASAASWMRAYERFKRSPSPQAMSQLTLQSRNLANTSNSVLGTNLTPEDFLKAIQGTSSSRAKDE